MLGSHGGFNLRLSNLIIDSMDRRIILTNAAHTTKTYADAKRWWNRPLGYL